MSGSASAIAPAKITPGRWMLRWVDGKNQEHVRKVVVQDLGGESLWVRFTDEQWQPLADSNWTLAGYLPKDAGFLAPSEVASDE